MDIEDMLAPEIKINNVDYLNQLIFDFGCDMLYIDDICIYNEKINKESLYILFDKFFVENSDYMDKYIKTIEVDMHSYHCSTIYLKTI